MTAVSGAAEWCFRRGDLIAAIAVAERHAPAVHVYNARDPDSPALVLLRQPPAGAVNI